MQQIARHFPQHGLDAAVVHIDKVLEHEHQILDLLTHLLVRLADGVHQLTFDVGIEVVHDVGCSLQAAHLGCLGTRRTGELFLHDVVQLLQRRWLYLFQVGDTHNQIEAHLLGELAQDLGRLLRLQIGEHDGLDLRVFVLDDAGHLTGIHPLERIEAAGTGTENDLVHQVARLVFAKGGHQRFAHEIFAADTDVGVLLDIVDELTVYRRYPVVTEI